MRTIPLGLSLLAVITAAVLCIAVEAQAQTPPDVPAIAQDEIARRGSHVEMTGTIRSGLMAAALSPPADDSAKWFLTLIVKPGEVSSEKMKATIANDPAMRPWVDARDPSKSAMHYHVRSIDDATQADWLQGLRPAIQRTGLPLVVLQPPKNGQFGPSATIVKMVAGPITGEQLAARLREGIIAYVQTIEMSGISQSSIGVPPPFNVPPKEPVQPLKPEVPFDWPPTPPTNPPATPPNPSVPAPEFPTSWLALTALGTYVMGWVSARLKTSVGAKVAEFNRILATLNSVPKDPIPKEPPPA